MEGYGGSIPPWVSEWMADVREHGKVTYPCPSSAAQAKQFKADRAAAKRAALRAEQLTFNQRKAEITRIAAVTKEENRRVAEMRRAAEARLKARYARIEFHEDPNVRDPRFREVLAEVAASRDVRIEDILGPSHIPSIAHARHEAMYLCKARTDHSYTTIGRFMDRDHTTVISGVQAHCRRNKIPRPDGERG